MFGCKKVDDGVLASTNISNAVREGRHWYVYLPVDVDMPLLSETPRLHVCGLVKNNSSCRSASRGSRKKADYSGGMFSDDPDAVPLDSRFFASVPRYGDVDDVPIGGMFV